MELILDPKNIEDYKTFLRVKSLPIYRVRGRSVWFPDEYASRLGKIAAATDYGDYHAPDWMFDYQSAITEMAIRKRKYSGEIVFSPFAGIGSEGYEAIKLGRRFYGCEIKPEYIEAARKNLARAETIKAEATRTLFDMVQS